MYIKEHLNPNPLRVGQTLRIMNLLKIKAQRNYTI